MLIIFDLDGTLIDSACGVIKSIDYTLEVFELDFLDEEIKKSFIGPPIYDSLKHNFNLTDKKTKEVADFFRSIYKEKFLYEAKVYEDIPVLLQILKQSDNKLAVATYKRQDYAELILRYFNLDVYFEFIKGSDFDGKLTKMDIIGACLKEFDVNDAVMIGDTLHDKKGAHALNIDFIGVSWGYGFRKDEADANDVYEIIKKINIMKNNRID